MRSLVIETYRGYAIKEGLRHYGAQFAYWYSNDDGETGCHYCRSVQEAKDEIDECIEEMERS